MGSSDCHHEIYISHIKLAYPVVDDHIAHREFLSNLIGDITKSILRFAIGISVFYREDRLSARLFAD